MYWLIYDWTNDDIISCVLGSAVPLLLVQPLAWGKLDKQPATGYLLGQFTMPWEEKFNDVLIWLASVNKWNHYEMLGDSFTRAVYLCIQCCRLCEAETVGGRVHTALRHLAARPHRRHAAGHPRRTHGIKHFCGDTINQPTNNLRKSFTQSR